MELIRSDAPADASGGGPLLEVEDLRVWYPVQSGLLRRRVGWVKAVDGVSLTVGAGETVGLVGESGSGKTTTGRAIVRVAPIRSGRVRLRGVEFSTLDGKALRRERRRIQMIFQDPRSSLDPRQTVGSILAEPLETHDLAKGKRRERIEELLQLVGLDPAFVDRYPHEFSGGQLQRIGIARALAVSPDLIVCDEPVSSLDVSIRAQVVNLLIDLQSQLGLAYLFIGHDLAVVRQIADQLFVMYLGGIVESGPAAAVYECPAHPYTVALLSAVPVPDPRIERTRRRILLTGDIPSPSDPPSGCRFHPRCWLRAQLGDPAICAAMAPALEPVAMDGTDHRVSCHFPDELRFRMPGQPTSGGVT